MVSPQPNTGTSTEREEREGAAAPAAINESLKVAARSGAKGGRGAAVPVPTALATQSLSSTLRPDTLI